MVIQGMRDTMNFAANERPENWRQMIMYLYPNGKTPLTALTGAMKESTTDDPVFHWWEKILDDRRLALGQNLGAPASGTVETITLAAGSNAITFVRGDNILVEETDEHLRVNSDPTSNLAIEVVRGANGSTPVAVTFAGAGVNPNLLAIGSAHEEGSLAPTGANYDPTERSNYTQIFRRTSELTGTASKTRLRTVPAVKEARRELLEYYSVDQERAFWLGRQSAGTLNNKPIRTTAGVYNQMDAGNIFQFPNGEVDMDTIETQMEIIFRFGSNEKVAFCGNKALSAINTAVRKNSAYQWHTGEKKYGMDVTRLICPHGTILFKTHPLFTQVSGGTTGGASYYGMNTWAFILDMAEIEYRYMTGRDTQYEGDLAQIGQDGLKFGYKGECGIELHHPITHHLWQQVDLGVEDL